MSVRGFSLWFLRLCSRHSGKLIFASLVFFISASYLTSHLIQAADLHDQLDPNMQSTKDLKELESTFSNTIGLIGFIEKNDSTAWTNSDLCQIQNWINSIFDEVPQVNSIFSPFNLRKSKVTDSKVTFPYLLEDPCVSAHPQSLSRINETPWNNMLTDARATQFTVALGLNKLEIPGPYGTFDPELVRRLFTMASEKLNPLKISWIGIDAQQYYSLEGLGHAQILNFAVIFILLAGVRLFVGTWRAAFMFISTLFVSASLVYGGMALFHHPVDILSACLFLMLSVASLEDFIFISHERLSHPHRPFRESFRKLAVPSFYTSLTTALGFGSLCISSLASIQRFGFWAALGSMFEWFLVFCILPAFMIRFPALQNWAFVKRSFFLKWGERATEKTPSRWLTRTALLVFPFALWSSFHFNLAQNPSATFPQDHPMTQALDHLQESRGWIATASLVFQPNLADAKKNEILAQLSSEDLVHSIETKNQVIDFLTMNGDSFRREWIERSFTASSMSDRYESRSGQTRALLMLKDTDTAKINNLRNTVYSFCPEKECHLAGEFVAFADYSTSLIQTLFESFFLSLGLVSLILAYLNYQRGYDFKNLIWLLISSFWGPAAMLCMIYMMDINVNMITCMVASILVGLTGDNAIQYLFAGKKNLKQGIRLRGAASVQCGILMSLCSLVFLGSYFEPPRVLGILLALGFTTALIGDLWILKGLDKNY